MDNQSFTDFLIADSEVESIGTPEIKDDYPVHQHVEDEQAAIRKRRENKEKEIEWNGGGVKKDYFNYDYDNSKEAIINKTKKMSAKLIIFIVIVVVISFFSSIVLFVKSLQSKSTDVTSMREHTEQQFAKDLGMDFKENEIFARLVRVHSDDKVTAKTNSGFGIVYIDGKQQGIFFDSTKYELYGLQVGDKCDDNFNKLKYPYEKVMKETVDYSEGFKNYCYLYNTRNGDCMIVSYDTRTNKILELGYFYDYKLLIYQ